MTLGFVFVFADFLAVGSIRPAIDYGKVGEV